MSKRAKVYVDPAGLEVPTKYVKAYDKLRDDIARRIERLWRDEQARLVKVKGDTVGLIGKLQEAAAIEAGVSLGGEKGNIQFRSFDGNVTVAVDRQFRTEFDERLKFAQALIMEAIGELTEKSESADLSEIARRAFEPRKSGNLDMQRIRDLRKYNVKHPKWKQACDIIAECERVVGHRDYIRVTVRTAPDSTPEAIVLDIAAL
jgi:hypothetical protein